MDALLRKLPPVRYAFGYGSGVMKQANAKIGEQPMIDAILVVDNPIQWHRENLQRSNGNHYSFLRFMGANTIAKVQQRGAGVYFNPFVEVDGKQFKYGVISTTECLADLTEWYSLYVAGRLHKPVSVAKDDPVLSQAVRTNRNAALHAALLVMDNGVDAKQRFTERDLYESITRLSYNGDIRMKLRAENPNKVRNIVLGQRDQFRSVYEPLWRQHPHLRVTGDSYQAEGLVFEYPFGSRQSKAWAFSQLPFSLQYGLSADTRRLDVELEKRFSHIVGRSSVQQTLKGVLTAGPLRSLRYAAAKLVKAFRR